MAPGEVLNSMETKKQWRAGMPSIGHNMNNEQIVNKHGSLSYNNNVIYRFHLFKQIHAHFCWLGLLFVQLYLHVIRDKIVDSRP